MSRKFLTSIDLAKNELQNAIIQNLASSPSSPIKGQKYFDTTLNQEAYYNGTAWVYLSAGAAGVVSKSANATVAGVVQVSGGADKSIADYTSAGGIVKVNTAGLASIAAAGTDYQAVITATGILKGSGAGSVAAAVSGTDYAPATSGSTALKGNGAGGFGVAILNDVGSPTAVFSMNNQKISNLLDPTNPQDAATKAYADAIAQGIDPKNSVPLATTAALATNTYNNGTAGVGATLTAASNAALSIDSIATTAGMRVLIKNEATAANNGIYTVTQIGSGALPYILTRATDADTGVKLNSGALVYIEQGTVNGTQQWIMNTVGAITIGTTSLGFTQFSGASVTTAGNGLVAVGNVFNVGAGAGIIAAADTITVDRATNGATVPFKFTQTIGDGTSTSIACTHNLGTQDVLVQIRDAATNARVEADIVNTSTTVSTITFAVAPATNAYKVVIIG